MNRLNRMPTGQTDCKKFWKFDRMFLEEWGIHEKKRYAISSSEKGDVIKIITKNQCSTSADSMNRLNRMPTGCKKFWKFDIWKSKESMKKKRCAIPSLNEGAMIKTSPSAPNLNMPL